MGSLICKKCAGVAAGESTVGALISEGDKLQKEGFHKNHLKFLDALNKYNEAGKLLKNNGGCENCIKAADGEYMSLYKSIQGSRA